MTIQGVYTQQLTLTFSTSSFSSSSSSPAPAAATAPEAVKPEPLSVKIHAKFGRLADTATLSKEALNREAEATAKSPAEATPGADATAPETSENKRGDALFEALDADGDGTVTEEEFVAGARELLRRAHRHHRGHHHGHERADGVRHGHSHEGGRLERRLGRLFDLVDTNGDGQLAKSELSAALEKTGRQPSSGGTASSTAPAATTVVEAPAAEPAAAQNAVASKAEVRAVAVNEPAVVDGPNQATKKDAASETPAVGNFVTVNQITVVTVAIRQYTTVTYSDTPGQAEPFRVAA